MTEKSKNKGNFPNLRFPGFTEEWEVKKLGEIFNISAGGDIKSENVSQIRNGKFQYPIYANAEKNKGFYGFSDLYKIDENALTVAGRGINVGIAHARDHKFYPIVRLLVLKPLKDENIYFFENQINRLYLFKESTGVPQLTVPQISDYYVYYPSFSEQNKIASFLNIIDERIKTQKKIIKNLETLMSGLREKIFSQKLRFKDKDGNDFPDWKTIKVNDLCNVKKGEQLNKEELSNTGSFPCLNGGINFSGYTEKFNSDENTITISEGGNSCGYVNFIISKFWLGGHCYKILLKEKYSKKYFYHLLKFNELRIMNLRVGSGLPNIQQKDLKNLDLVVSNKIEEQNKIAQFLSSFDEKINLEKDLLFRYENQKKYLLANLFI